MENAEETEVRNGVIRNHSRRCVYVRVHIVLYVFNTYTHALILEEVIQTKYISIIYISGKKIG